MSFLSKTLRGFRKMACNIADTGAFKDRIIWMDLEMTGLDVNVDQILEAACIITDSDLNIVAKMNPLVIHHSNEVLNNMNEWCIKQHGLTGLTDESRKSNLTVTDAENELLSFMKEHTPPNSCPLAGNSVSYDKRFIDRYMPKLSNHLHYRIIDVSTVKELCRRWYPKEFSEVKSKMYTHRALDDILESIEELKMYRRLVFKVPQQDVPQNDFSG